MNPTPPCPTCGSPLRWFPEHNAWGCDRERKMLPAAVPQQPPQPQWGQPQAAAAAPHAPRAPRTPAQKKKLILIAAIGGVVVAGGLVAFLLLKGGGGPSGGADSPEVLAKAAAKAISDGDVDGYLKLSGMEDLSGMVSCHFPDDNMIADFMDMQKLGAKRNMGIELEVESVREDDDEKVKTEKAGKYLFDSCKLTKDISTHKFKVRMKEGSAVERTTMTAMKVGDRWYFSNFDDLPKSDKWDEDDDKDSMESFSEISKKKKAKIRKETGGSPESAAKAMVDAMSWRSSNRAEAIAVRRYDDEFEELFKCEGYDSELTQKIEHTDSLIRKMTRPDDDGDDDDDDDDEPRKREKVEVTNVKVKDKGKVGAGDDLLGCRVTESMETAMLEADLTVDGKKEDDPLKAMAVKIGDHWRILWVDEG